MATELKIEHIIDLNLLKVKVTGDYSVSDDTELLKRCLVEFAEKKCTSCLIDFREADVSVMTLPLIKRSDLFKFHNIPRSAKIAGLFTEITSDVSFAETGMKNRGWLIKMFTDQDAAMDWLQD